MNSKDVDNFIENFIELISCNIVSTEDYGTDYEIRFNTWFKNDVKKLINNFLTKRTNYNRNLISSLQENTWVLEI